MQLCGCGVVLPIGDKFLERGIEIERRQDRKKCCANFSDGSFSSTTYRLLLEWGYGPRRRTQNLRFTDDPGGTDFFVSMEFICQFLFPYKHSFHITEFNFTPFDLCLFFL